MAKRIVYDRWDNEIYLTDERWEHILDRHEELIGLFGEVIETLQFGKRRQEVLDPNRYRYYQPCALLPPEFNHIVVAVVFRYQESPNDIVRPNNFVTSAWGVDIYRER